MKTCPVCGSKMSDTNTYCGICGAAVEDKPKPAPKEAPKAAEIKEEVKAAAAVQSPKETSTFDEIDKLENEINSSAEDYQGDDLEYAEVPEEEASPAAPQGDSEEKKPKLREITPDEIERTEKEIEAYENDFSKEDLELANNNDGKSGSQKFKDACTNIVYKIKDFFTNTKDETDSIEETDIEKNKTISLMSYLGLLVYYIPMMLKPRSKYLRFHGNQGLILTIAGLAVAIVNGLLCAFFGYVFAESVLGIRQTNGFGIFMIALLSTICYGAIIIWSIVGIYNGVTGKAKELPLIGKFRILK